MKLFAMKINVILATLAFIAGISAAFTHHADRNNLYPTWKYKTDRIEKQKLRLISADRLANLVYRKEQGLTILDARSSDEYERYHIPSAILYNEKDLLSALSSSDEVVLCGKKDYSYLSGIPENLSGKIYHLDGGIEEWFRIILFPDFNSLHIRNRQKLEEILNRCSYFGGKPENTDRLNISKRSSRFREGC